MASRKIEVRKDPEFFGGDFSTVFQVKNARPDRKYLWVFNGAASSGPSLDYYENIEGWEVEMWADGGPVPNGRKMKKGEEGKEIVVLDHTLMSIDREVWEARRRQGQARADAIEKKMIRRRNQVDRMRGIGNLHGENFNNDRYTRFDADIDRLRPDMGEG